MMPDVPLQVVLKDLPHLTPPRPAGEPAPSPAPVPWSEREAVVAYLLSLEPSVVRPAGVAEKFARGDHMTAARRGDLDGLRERVKEMCRGNG